MPSLRQLLGLAGRREIQALTESVKKAKQAAGKESKHLREESTRLREEVGRLRMAVERSLLRGPGNPCAGEKHPGTMAGVFERLARRGCDVATVIDIGASDGRWSLQAMETFPRQHYLLIEAQGVHREALEAFAASHPNVQVAMAAAGRAPGQIHFDATDPFGGQASDTPYAANDIVVPVTTLDQETASRDLPGPYLIKFDTHGFEAPILDGAARTLENTNVIIMECYNFRISPDCLLFHEMCDRLALRRFRCVDMAEVLRRPMDGALWQMDLVFVRADRPEFQSSQYH